MKNMFKILSLVFTLLFIWAAYVQYNDPDALLWYAIYGVAAAASLFFYLGKLNVTAAVILSFIYLVSTFVMWPDQYEGVTIGNGDIYIDLFHHQKFTLSDTPDLVDVITTGTQQYDKDGNFKGETTTTSTKRKRN